ncbi:Splicing factor-like protein [Paramyrothecium foliicola]|nr:Splicing factor-like protein [Paramyrothecium foliicola]
MHNRLLTMSALAGLEEEKKQYQEQVEIVTGQLRDDPGNVELKALQAELNNLVDLLNENIAELKPQQTQKPNQPTQPVAAPAAAPAEPEKWSRENHPAFKKATVPVEEKEEPSVNYQVNDTVLAKWVSGDKAFYPARITSITGSSTAPIYTVKFKSYDNTETLRSKDIRPVSNKRKADAVSSAPATPPVATPPAPGVVTTAGATVYPDAKKDAEKLDDAAKPPKPKKIKAKKELEAGKNKWQEFNAKSKFGKTQKKDSMFRTPEGIHGRVADLALVGFTGSGQAMRKDPTRSRHIYQVNDEAD